MNSRLILVLLGSSKSSLLSYFHLFAVFWASLSGSPPGSLSDGDLPCQGDCMLELAVGTLRILDWCCKRCIIQVSSAWRVRQKALRAREVSWRETSVRQGLGLPGSDIIDLNIGLSCRSTANICACNVYIEYWGQFVARMERTNLGATTLWSELRKPTEPFPASQKPFLGNSLQGFPT